MLVAKKINHSDMCHMKPYFSLERSIFIYFISKTVLGPDSVSLNYPGKEYCESQDKPPNQAWAKLVKNCCLSRDKIGFPGPRIRVSNFFKMSLLVASKWATKSILGQIG